MTQVYDPKEWDKLSQRQKIRAMEKSLSGRHANYQALWIQLFFWFVLVIAIVMAVI